MGNELNSFGYDEFIGREIFKNKKENFVSLDLHSKGSISYTSINQACDNLCSLVKEGKKVLLFKSPGNCEEEEQNDSEIFNILNQTVNNLIKERNKAIIKGSCEGSYTLCERSYQPFNTKQMETLEKMYESKIDMKLLPNPFLNQPK